MNNRTQQRFDRSIRDAVSTTEAVKEREAAAYLEKKRRRYAKEIIQIEALLQRGSTKSGRVLAKKEMKELREMLEFRKQFVGTCA